MLKEILAAFCMLTIMASTTPIFAASTTTPVVLTDSQLPKLIAVQTELKDLVTQIDGLKTTYNNTTRGKGLLTSLNILKNRQTNSTKQ